MTPTYTITFNRPIADSPAPASSAVAAARAVVAQITKLRDEQAHCRRLGNLRGSVACTDKIRQLQDA